MHKFDKDKIKYPLRTSRDLKQKGYAIPIESTSDNEMQSSKQVKDLQINLKKIRLDFFWKNKNVCMFAGLVGVRGAGKQRAGSFSPLLFKYLPRRLGMNMLRLT